MKDNTNVTVVMYLSRRYPFKSVQPLKHSLLQQTALCFLAGSRSTPDSWAKGFKFDPRQTRPNNVLLQSQLPVLTLILCPFHPCVNAAASNRPRSFYQKCRWQITAAQTWGNEFARNSSVNAPPPHLSSLRHCGLIFP